VHQILTDPAACIGCRLCELACSLAKDGMYRPALSRIRVTNSIREGVSIPLLCRQCTQCGPLSVCPEEAISRPSGSSAILVDAEKCTGCARCAPACPYGALGFHPETRQLLVCDLCGGEPACVPYCVTGAITAAVGIPEPPPHDRASEYVAALKQAVLGARPPQPADQLPGHMAGGSDRERSA
jgi:anaerobic carbon-monoxide dehydrogenase iron sulfur subunit